MELPWSDEDLDEVSEPSSSREASLLRSSPDRDYFVPEIDDDGDILEIDVLKYHAALEELWSASAVAPTSEEGPVPSPISSNNCVAEAERALGTNDLRRTLDARQGKSRARDGEKPDPGCVKEEEVKKDIKVPMKKSKRSRLSRNLRRMKARDELRDREVSASYAEPPPKPALLPHPSVAPQHAREYSTWPPFDDQSCRPEPRWSAADCEGGGGAAIAPHPPESYWLDANYDCRGIQMAPHRPEPYWPDANYDCRDLRTEPSRANQAPGPCWRPGPLPLPHPPPPGGMGPGPDDLAPRVHGAFFGGLPPIPTDPNVDPPLDTCFNCWLPGHRRFECPAPVTAFFCPNCGRRDEDLTTCPRCRDVHRALQAHEPLPPMIPAQTCRRDELERTLRLLDALKDCEPGLKSRVLAAVYCSP